MAKEQYKTRQMSQLLEYLKETSGSHLTVNDIASHFKDINVNIGTTTIYRQLEKMVNDNIVIKYNFDSESSACYEYVGSENNLENNFYHCKCEDCGKIIHLHCDEISKIGEHLHEDHGFKVNSMKTVFYGVCEDCQKERKKGI